jgi:predicted alpha/beta superfamily hydrolase
MPSGQRWVAYSPAPGKASTVVGDLRVLPGVRGLGNGLERDLLVHVPSRAMTTGRRYPVLYMHDGHNLFDEAASYSGEWQVDETLAALADHGLELIVVGIPNAGDGREVEYTPYAGLGGRIRGAGGGRAYLRSVVEIVKPIVDASFPTRPERAATGIMGSSLGGLISLWAAVEHAGTFGLIGAMSPAIIPGQGYILRRLRRLAIRPERIYVDTGGREGAHAPTAAQAARWSAGELASARILRSALLDGGLPEPDVLRYIEDETGIHHETAWARRLPDALRFLFEPFREGPVRR